MSRKSSVKAIVNGLFITCYYSLYLFAIYTFYDKSKDGILQTFGIRGYIIISFLYIFLITFLLRLYGSFKLGNKRILDIALSNVVSITICNIVSYLVFSLIAGYLVNAWPYVLLTIGQCCFGVLFSMLGNRIVRFSFPPSKTIVIHCKDNYETTLNKLKQYQMYEFDIVSSLSEDEIDYSDLKKLLKEFESIVTIQISHEHKKQIVKSCYELDKPVYDVPSITDVIIKASEITNFMDTPLLRLNKLGPNEAQKFIKRSMDIVGSILLIVVSSPLMLYVAYRIKKEDHGDIFFKQDRLTTNGKKFKLIKFRSMIMNAEPDGKPIKAKENDERLTNIGRFIRRTRIDELPQVFNILQGDLSFIGPRALRVEEYEENEETFPEFKYRLKVKAGLSGYAQIYGKYNTSYRDKLLLDLYYIENYKVTLDIRLIFMTMITMVTKSSTEGFEEHE